MLTVNQVTIVGNLAGDVEIRSLNNGNRVANLRIVTDDGYRNEAGDWVKRPNFHRVNCFIQSIVDFLEDAGKKGAPFMIQGKIMNRKFVDNAGVEKWSTEITADLVNALGARPKTEEAKEEAPAQTRTRGRNQQKTPAHDADYGDDIPF